jgi:hypothetical protein
LGLEVKESVFGDGFVVRRRVEEGKKRKKTAYWKQSKAKWDPDVIIFASIIPRVITVGVQEAIGSVSSRACSCFLSLVSTATASSNYYKK